ncbi:MAG: HAMP domain-containing histidine kinase [Oscillospiraceae bacterium]|mgnify:CR=1 FL=1|nr:HAMP domain-containing histidine kinase [Oscillospiraceae bacterium]
MKSIYFRNFIATAVLVISCFLIIGTTFFFLGRSFLIDDTEQRLNANAEEIARTASAKMRQEELGSWDLRMTISSIAGSTRSHIFICDQDGLVLSCSDLVLYCSEHQGRRLSENTLRMLKLTGEMQQLTTLDDFYPQERLVAAKPIEHADSVIGYVFVSTESMMLVGVWRTFIGVALAVSAAVMFIAMLMSLIFSKKIAEPLDELTRAARKFAHGDFSVRVENTEKRDDELGALLDSFNSMADSLEKSERQRQEFIANVSHELRTPMTTIAGFADGILDGTIPKEQEEKYLRKIADETRRLSRLVRSMLDSSQAGSKALDKTKRRKFDLSELTLQTLLSFEARATEKNLDVDPQLPEDPIMVIAEPDSITQVLYNLTDNAVKFAERDSTIRIRLYKSGNKAYVSVKNRGETIPADDLSNIFDRFHKSDRSRSMDKDGVGLGLYLVKTIINNHGEDIAVTSRDGVTEFVFTLPLA